MSELEVQACRQEREVRYETKLSYEAAEDEDPQIRRNYEAALKKTGAAMQMPAFTYRDL